MKSPLLSALTLSLAVFSANSVMAENHKPLILYFSQPQEIDSNNKPVSIETIDAHSGASVILKNNALLGSNEYLAKQIQAHTGGDLQRIETVEPYTTNHKQLLDYGQQEQRKNIKPALKTKVDLAGYDTVFVSYPIWWYKLPMAMQRFFEENDFSGKKLILIAGHGQSKFSGTTQVVRKLQPNAEVIEGLEVNMWDMTKADEQTEQRLRERLVELGFTK